VLTRAIRIHERGGVDAMRWDEVETGEPGPGEVLIRNTAVGLNFVDPGHRSGLRTEGRYETPLPMVLGTEGAGVVEKLGPDVTSFKVGDRVGYWYSPPGGAYCQARVYPIARLVKLPADITEEMAAAALCKGMTANMLLREAYSITHGDPVLVHAAAGATGHLVAQWAKHLGATVIGTVSTEEKAEFARAHGCDHVIVYTRDDFVTGVRELTDGKGVPVVYDSVGRDTFLKSLDCLAFRGTCLLYGLSSGQVELFDPTQLSIKGCLYLSRPSTHQYHPTPELFQRSAMDVFDVIRSGAVKLHIGQRFPLQNVAEAHLALEQRRTIGATVLIP
jgi:NADPH2:quinone reductase